MGNIKIGRKDVIWNYAATFMKVGVSVILLPFILRVFPQETVGIWTIFSTIITLTSLLDFGFNPSFARNVSYVVSGVKKLKIKGFYVIENSNDEIDYSLFKGLINAMRWFYSRVAVILLVLLATAGTYYIHTILKAYTGDHAEVYIAWSILVVINTYSLYTMYYDSLMQGKGLIKQSKQIQIIGQSLYLVVAAVMILLRFNLIAIVSAQALSIIVRRVLSYRTIYTKNFKRCLRTVCAQPLREILKPVYPNAVKIGLTGLGGCLVSRFAIIIGSLYLSLGEIASYGITIQIIGVISSIASVYFATYQPKIAQYRIHNDTAAIRKIYLKGCWLLFWAFIIGGASLIFLGDWALQLIKSQTPLLPKHYAMLALLFTLLEANHTNASNILLTKNEVPFFKAALFAGACTVILLFVFLEYTSLGVLGMIIAPGIAQGCYQNWKWPAEVVKELAIRTSDIKNILARK